MTVRGGGFPTSPLAFMPIGRMGPPLRSFAADAHDCIVVPVPWTYRIQGCGAIQPRPKAGSPLIVIPTVSSCSKRQDGGLARSNQEPDDGKNASPCLTQKAPYKRTCTGCLEMSVPLADTGMAADHPTLSDQVCLTLHAAIYRVGSQP